MAQESWLAPTPQFASVSIADGAALQDEITDVLALAGWTDEGGDRWKSPVAGTHWIAVTFAQPDADKLSIVADDHQGRTFPERRIISIGAATVYDIFANPFGFVVSGPAAGKWLAAGVLDHFPKAQNSHVLDTYAGGGKNDADADTSDTTIVMPGPKHDGTIQGTGMVFSLYAMLTASTVPCMRYLNGVRRDAPAIAWVNSAGSIYKMAGRPFHLMQVDGALSVGAEITVVIDEGETAIFRVTRITAAGGAPTLKMAAMKEKA